MPILSILCQWAKCHFVELHVGKIFNYTFCLTETDVDDEKELLDLILVCLHLKCPTIG